MGRGWYVGASAPCVVSVSAMGRSLEPVTRSRRSAAYMRRTRNRSCLPRHVLLPAEPLPPGLPLLEPLRLGRGLLDDAREPLRRCAERDARLRDHGVPQSPRAEHTHDRADAERQDAAEHEAALLGELALDEPVRERLVHAVQRGT